MKREKNLKFLCIGSATQDIFLSRSPEFTPVREKNGEDFEFRLGDKIVVDKIDFRTGGGASNAATTFSRNGHDALIMTTVGKDPAADAVFRDFDREGIDTSFVSVRENLNTDYSTLMLAPDGERTILTYRGCGEHLRAADFDVEKVFAKAVPDWIYITGLAGHFAIYDDIFRESKKRGVKIAWNPSSFELNQPEKLRSLLEDVEILSVNREEAQKIVNGKTCEELSRKLADFVPVALVTDGRNGVVAVDKTSVVEAGLYAPDAKRVDATGAGDAFASGFVAKYAEGKSLRESVIFASANSASVVVQVGAKPGILTGREKLLDMKISVKPRNY